MKKNNTKSNDAMDSFYAVLRSRAISIQLRDPQFPEPNSAPALGVKIKNASLLNNQLKPVLPARQVGPPHPRHHHHHQGNQHPGSQQSIG